MNVRLAEIIDKINGNIEFVYRDENLTLTSKDSALEKRLVNDYVVVALAVKGDVLSVELENRKPSAVVLEGKWVKEHKEKFGEEPSFF